MCRIIRIDNSPSEAFSLKCPSQLSIASGVLAFMKSMLFPQIQNAVLHSTELLSLLLLNSGFFLSSHTLFYLEALYVGIVVGTPCGGSTKNGWKLLSLAMSC